MREVVAVAKALGDPSRMRILLALRQGELCVCQLVSLLELAPSTVSKHVGVLRQAGLVESRKNGRWVFYRRAGRDAPAAVRSVLAWLDASASQGDTARRDAARLQEILRTDLETLCRTVLAR